MCTLNGPNLPPFDGLQGRFQIPRLKFPISWCTCGYVPPQFVIHSLQSAALCKPLPCSVVESCSCFSPQPTAIQTQAKHFAFLHTHTIHSTPLYNALSIMDTLTLSFLTSLPSYIIKKHYLSDFAQFYY